MRDSERGKKEEEWDCESRESRHGGLIAVRGERRVLGEVYVCN